MRVPVGVVPLVGRSLRATLEVAQPLLARRAERQPFRLQVGIVADIEERVADVLRDIDANVDALEVTAGFGPQHGRARRLA